MSKSFKILIALAAIVAMATPAMAGLKLGGYFRVQGYSQTAQDLGAEDADTLTVIDQRFRPKLSYTLNDYVSFTYYGEVDTTWGKQSKGSIGGGGEVGADGVNIETKNVFVDFKIPDTTSKLRLGIQGYKDPFEGVVVWDDMAAANLSGALGPLDYTLLYSKWDEGVSDTAWDDADFYGLDLFHTYGDFAKAGVAGYYLDDNSDDLAETELWFAGLYGDYRFSVFRVEGFVVYNGGTVDDANDLDADGWVGSVKGNMVVSNGEIGLRYIYYSERDGEDLEFQGSQGNFEFVNENLQIFLVDKFVNNVPKNRYAIRAALAGYGLHAVTFSGNFKNLPMDTHFGFGAGAFYAADDEPDGLEEVDDAEIGYEVAARIGKTFAEKYDVSLRGAYAMVGDFYNTVENDEDPDDVYTAVLMINVPF